MRKIVDELLQLALMLSSAYLSPDLYASISLLFGFSTKKQQINEPLKTKSNKVREKLTFEYLPCRLLFFVYEHQQTKSFLDVLVLRSNLLFVLSQLFFVLFQFIY
jgi:hypothetical protein